MKMPEITIVSASVFCVVVFTCGTAHLAEPAVPEQWAIDEILRLGGIIGLAPMSSQEVSIVKSGGVVAMRLRDVNLSRRPIQDQDLRFLAALNDPPLLRLHLAGTRITDDGLALISKSKSLYELDISDTRVSSAGLRHIVVLSNMCRLHLSGTQVCDEDMDQIRKLTKLIELRLDRTRITGAGLARLTELPRLDNLSLRETPIVNPDMEVLAQFAGLTAVDLSYTAISDDGLRAFEGMNRLQELNVANTNVTPEGIQRLRQHVPSCRIHVSGLAR